MTTVTDAADRIKQRHRHTQIEPKTQMQTKAPAKTKTETDRHRHNSSVRERRDNSDAFPGLSAGAERAAGSRCCGAGEKSAR